MTRKTVRPDGDNGGTATSGSRKPDHKAPPSFAHPSEKELSQILAFYGPRWEYEPRSFALRWDGDKIVEMMTPDFFLPDLDLYVELTTMKQSLVTQKNRKIRMMREQYPEINVKLLYRRDFHRLLAKFGFGPLGNAEVRGIDRVLLTTQQVQQRVASLGRQISQDYAGRQPILVGVQRGMVCFMADRQGDHPADRGRLHVDLPLRRRRAGRCPPVAGGGPDGGAGGRRREVQELHVLQQQLQTRALPSPESQEGYSGPPASRPRSSQSTPAGPKKIPWWKFTRRR